ISVMSRMAGKGAFSIDHEVGRKMVRRLGSLRPFIGATFAVAIYFGLQSTLFTVGAVPKTTYFYTAVSVLPRLRDRSAAVVRGRAVGGADEGGRRRGSGAARPRRRGGGRAGVVLRGGGAGVGPGGRREPPLQHVLLPRRDRLLGLLVQRDGRGRRPAPVVEAC